MVDSLRDRRRSLSDKVFEQTDPVTPRRRRDRQPTLSDRLFEETRDAPVSSTFATSPLTDDEPRVARGLEQGAAEVRGSFRGAKAIGQQLLGNEEGARESQRAAQEEFERGQRVGPRVQDVGSIQSTEDLADFIVGGFGRVLPSAGTAFLGGGVGGAVGGFAARRFAQKGISDAVKRSLAQRGTQRGATAGLVPPSVAQESGAIFAEAEGADSDLSRNQQALASIGGGSLAASLDVLPQTRILRRVLSPEQFTQARRSILREAGKQAAAEGVTEASQEFIQKATNKFIDDNVELFSEETLNEIATGGALGIIGGGTLGPLPALTQNAQEFLSKAQSRDGSKFFESNDDTAPETKSFLGASADQLRRAGGRANSEIRKVDNLVRSIFGDTGFQRASLEDSEIQTIDNLDIEQLIENNPEALAQIEEIDPDFLSRPNLNAALKDIVESARARIFSREQGLEGVSTDEEQLVPEGEDIDPSQQSPDEQLGPEFVEPTDDEQVTVGETGVAERDALEDQSRLTFRAKSGSTKNFPSPFRKPRKEGEQTSLRKKLSPDEEVVSFDQLVDDLIDIPSTQRTPRQRALVGNEDFVSSAAKQEAREMVAERLIADERRRGRSVEDLEGLPAREVLAKFETAVSQGPVQFAGEVNITQEQFDEIKQKGQQADPKDPRFGPLIAEKDGKPVRLDPRALTIDAINSNTRIRQLPPADRIATGFSEGVSSLIEQGLIDNIQQPADETVIAPAGEFGDDITFGEIRQRDRVQQLRAKAKTAQTKESRDKFTNIASKIERDAAEDTEKHRNDLLLVRNDDLDPEQRKRIKQGIKRGLKLAKEDPQEFVRKGGIAELTRLQLLLARPTTQRLDAEQEIEFLESQLEASFQGDKDATKAFNEAGGYMRLSVLKQIIDPKSFLEVDREVYDSAHEELQARGGNILPKEVYPTDDKGNDAFDIITEKLEKVTADIRRKGAQLKNQIATGLPKNEELVAERNALIEEEKALRDVAQTLATTSLSMSLDTVARAQAQSVPVETTPLSNVAPSLEEQSTQLEAAVAREKRRLKDKGKDSSAILDQLQKRQELVKQLSNKVSKRQERQAKGLDTVSLDTEIEALEKRLKILGGDPISGATAQTPAGLREGGVVPSRVGLEKEVLDAMRKAHRDLRQARGLLKEDPARGSKIAKAKEDLLRAQRRAWKLVPEPHQKQIRVGDLEDFDPVSKLKRSSKARSKRLGSMRDALKKVRKVIEDSNTENPRLLAAKKRIDQMLSSEREVRSWLNGKDVAKFANKLNTTIDHLKQQIENSQREAELLASMIETGQIDQAQGIMLDDGTVLTDEILEAQTGTAEQHVAQSKVKKDLYHGTMSGSHLGLDHEWGGATFLSSSREVGSTYAGGETAEIDLRGVDPEEVLDNPEQFPSIIRRVDKSGEGFNIVLARTFFADALASPVDSGSIFAPSREEAIKIIRKDLAFHASRSSGIFTIKADIRNPIVADFKGYSWAGNPPSVGQAVTVEEFRVSFSQVYDEIAQKLRQAGYPNKALSFEQDREKVLIGKFEFSTDRLVEDVQDANAFLPDEQKIDAVEFRNIIDISDAGADAMFRRNGVKPDTKEAIDLITTTNYAVLDPKKLFLKNAPKEISEEIRQRLRATIASRQEALTVDQKALETFQKAMEEAGNTLTDVALAFNEGVEDDMRASLEIGGETENLSATRKKFWQEAKAKVNEYLQRSVGVNARFKKKVSTRSGQEVGGLYDPATDTIFISYQVNNPYSVAMHESLHYAFHNFLTREQKADLTRFFGKKKNLNRLIETIRNTDRIKDRYKQQVIDVISEDSARGVEERAAYGYQFWNAGEFVASPATNSVFEFIRKIFRDVLGIISSSERADLLFKALRDGDLRRGFEAKSPWRYPGLDDTGIQRGMRVVEDFTKNSVSPLFSQFVLPTTLWGQSHANPVVRRLMRRMAHNPLSPTTEATFLEKKQIRMRRFVRQWIEKTGWSDLHPAQQRAVRDAIYQQRDPSEMDDGAVRDYIETWREFMDNMHRYMRGAGLEVGYLQRYFPRVWDSVRINENKEQFLAILNRHKEEIAELGMTPEELLTALNRADGAEAALPDILVAIAERKFDEQQLDKDVIQELKDMNARQINDEIAKLSEREDQLVQEGSEQELLRVSQRKQAFEFWANNVLGTYTNAPGSMFTKQRTLKFLDNEDVSQFLEQDFEQVMLRYIESAVKRAEFTREFGKDGKDLRKQINEARKVGLSPKDEELLSDAVSAIRGTLGTNINPRFRKYSSYLLVWQNLALLALTAFTAMGDVSGVLQRSQDLKVFWNGIRTAGKNIAEDVFPREEIKKIKRRIKELEAKDNPTKEERAEFNALKKRRQEMKDSIRQVAEELGVLDSAALHASLNARFGGEFIYNKAEWWNNVFFKWNGLEWVTNVSRIMGTSAALSFIKIHASRAAEGNARSKSFLQELDLTLDDIVLDDEGELVVTKDGLMAKGNSRHEAAQLSDKLANAINRFVDQSIPRPNAGDRPAQLSNPHFMLIAHLKQFVFTFQTQILNRAGKQALDGNMKPMLYLFSFVPVMLAIDSLRHTVQYWWDEPDWDDDWDVFDHAYFATHRGGLLGMTEFVTEPMGLGPFNNTGIEPLIGPTGEASLKIMRSFLTGTPDPQSTFVGALPAQNLYKNWPIWSGFEEDGEGDTGPDINRRF